jgi:hypothetical protein
MFRKKESSPLLLKMEVVCYFETLVHIGTTRRYILEDGNLHNYRCDNFRSYIVMRKHVALTFYTSKFHPISLENMTH